MIEMTVEERWDRLDAALRAKEQLVGEAMELAARNEALKPILRHYAGMAIEAGCINVPCPECGGLLSGSTVAECRDCGARWSVQAIA